MNSDKGKQLALILRRRAMDLLARREHTRQELEQKLLSRLRRDAEKQSDSAADSTVPAADILAQVLDQLEADKLLSDARFTESFVSARSGRGYGPLYIRHQLRQKQVDDTLSQNSLEAIDQQQWQQQLIVLLRRKLGDAPIPAPLSKEYARLQRFVLARGFTQTQWRDVQKQWAQLIQTRQLH